MGRNLKKQSMTAEASVARLKVGLIARLLSVAPLINTSIHEGVPPAQRR